MEKRPEPHARPRQVNQGVMFLYAALGLAGIRSVLETMTTAKLLGSEFMWQMFTMTVGVFSLMFVTIMMIKRGRNWARILLFALFLISLSISLTPLVRSFQLRPLSGSLGIAQMALQTVAWIFLFHRDASRWFRPR
jgi:hypothetical protein